MPEINIPIISETKFWSDPADAIKDTKYDGNLQPSVIRREGLNPSLAENQRGWDTAMNGITRGVISGLATAVEDFAYLPNLFTQDFEANAIAQAAKDFKEELREELPIYRSGDNPWTWDNGAMFWESLAGVLDSGIGFAIPGLGIAKGVGLAGKGINALSKLGKYGARVSAFRQSALANPLIKRLSTSTIAGAISNDLEGTMMGVEIYENKVKELKAQRDAGVINFTDEQIKDMASEQASAFKLHNRAFALTDAFSLHGLTRGHGVTRNIINNPKVTTKGLKKALTSPDSFLAQGLTESFEEIAQGVLQKHAEYRIDKAAGINKDTRGTLERTIDYALDKETLYEGMLGFFGGGVQRVMSEAMNKGSEHFAKKRIDAKIKNLIGLKENLSKEEVDKAAFYDFAIQSLELEKASIGKMASYEKQQKIIEGIQKDLDISIGKDIKFSAEEEQFDLDTDAHKQMRQLFKDSRFRMIAAKHFQHGTTEKLEESLNNIEDANERQHYLTKLKEYEKAYINHSGSPIADLMFHAYTDIEMLQTRLDAIDTAISEEENNAVAVPEEAIKELKDIRASVEKRLETAKSDYKNIKKNEKSTIEKIKQYKIREYEKVRTTQEVEELKKEHADEGINTEGAANEANERLQREQEEAQRKLDYENATGQEFAGEETHYEEAESEEQTLAKFKAEQQRAEEAENAAREAALAQQQGDPNQQEPPPQNPDEKKMKELQETNRMGGSSKTKEKKTETKKEETKEKETFETDIETKSDSNVDTEETDALTKKVNVGSKLVDNERLAAFESFKEEFEDKEGTRVRFTISVNGEDYNSDAKRLQVEQNNNSDSLNQEDRFNYLVENAAIKVEFIEEDGTVITTDAGPVYTFLYTANNNSTNQEEKDRTREMRNGIIKAILNNENNEAFGEVQGQYPYTFNNQPSVDGLVPENKLNDVPLFGTTLSAIRSKIVFGSNGKNKEGKVVGGGPRWMNHKGIPDPELTRRGGDITGMVGIKVKNINGKTSVAKLNVKKFSREDAEFVWDLYKYAIESKQIDLAFPLDKDEEGLQLIQRFKSIVGDKVKVPSTMREMMAFFVHDGHYKDNDNQTVYNKDTQIRLHMRNLIFGDTSTKKLDDRTKESFIQFLMDKKRYNIKKDAMSSDSYMEWLVENGILNTDLDPNKPLHAAGDFSGSIFIKADDVKLEKEVTRKNNMTTPEQAATLAKISTFQRLEIKKDSTGEERYDGFFKRVSNFLKNYKGGNTNPTAIEIGNIVDEVARDFFAFKDMSDWTRYKDERGNPYFASEEVYKALLAPMKQLMDMIQKGGGQPISREITLKDPIAKIAGNPDLLIVWPNGGVTIVDFKAFIRGTDRLEEKQDGQLVKDYYKLQQNMYRMLAEKMGIPIVGMRLQVFHVQYEQHKYVITGMGDKSGLTEPLTEVSIIGGADGTKYSNKKVPNNPNDAQGPISLINKDNKPPAQQAPNQQEPQANQQQKAPTQELSDEKREELRKTNTLSGGFGNNKKEEKIAEDPNNPSAAKIEELRKTNTLSGGFGPVVTQEEKQEEKKEKKSVSSQKLTPKAQEHYDKAVKQYPETWDSVDDIETIIRSLNNSPRDKAIRNGLTQRLIELKEKLKTVPKQFTEKEAKEQDAQRNSVREQKLAAIRERIAKGKLGKSESTTNEQSTDPENDQVCDP